MSAAIPQLCDQIMPAIEREQLSIDILIALVLSPIAAKALITIKQVLGGK